MIAPIRTYGYVAAATLTIEGHDLEPGDFIESVAPLDHPDLTPSSREEYEAIWGPPRPPSP